jgi:hypothetical protein
MMIRIDPNALQILLVEWALHADAPTGVTLALMRQCQEWAAAQPTEPETRPKSSRRNEAQRASWTPERRAEAAERMRQMRQTAGPGHATAEPPKPPDPVAHKGEPPNG